MAKKMTVKSNEVQNSPQTVALNEAVEIVADLNCTLLLGNGLAVVLKKNQSCFIAPTTKGHHYFEVEYDKAPAQVQQTVSVAETSISGGSVVTETATVMSAMVAAGPTGDIVVP